MATEARRLLLLSGLTAAVCAGLAAGYAGWVMLTWDGPPLQHQGLGIMRKKDGVLVRVGPRQCRYSWEGTGRFLNGSRWSSGWHRWEGSSDG
jgi:hypothetical protein